MTRRLSGLLLELGEFELETLNLGGFDIDLSLEKVTKQVHLIELCEYLQFLKQIYLNHLNFIELIGNRITHYLIGFLIITQPQ